MFSDVEIENRTIHHCENLFILFLEDVDIKKMQVSSMVSSEVKIDILLVTKMMIRKLNH